jgi:NADH-quinone oxidoreductase subunit N
VLHVGFGGVDFTARWAPLLGILAALTMTVANVVALGQSNIKRLLAYSSIAHAGYILMALVPYGQGDVAAESVASALFYLVAYAFTSFAAWAVVIAVERSGEQGTNLEDLAGLGRSHPGLAAVMSVAMLSFTGVPPTLGFVGKFYLFRTVIDGGYIGLALIGVLTSLVSAFYYLRVIVIMYMRDGEPVVRREFWLYLTAFSAALHGAAEHLFNAIIELGFYGQCKASANRGTIYSSLKSLTNPYRRTKGTSKQGATTYN